jgi:hypothetical protein
MFLVHVANLDDPPLGAGGESTIHHDGVTQLLKNGAARAMRSRAAMFE